MKVKCINNQSLPVGENLTLGKIYEAGKDEYSTYVTNDDGDKLGYHHHRFEEVQETLEDELLAAKARVSEIETLIKARGPKVGDKYKHKDGSVYMICQVGSDFCFICIEEAEFKGYLGDEYYGKFFPSIDNLSLSINLSIFTKI